MADEPISKLDLLAYADGLLDRDPRRKAMVDKAIGRSPELAEELASLIAQTAALRRAYAPRLDDPIPERLSAVLEPKDARHYGGALRAALLCLIMLGSVAAGWFGAQFGSDVPEPGAASDLVDRAYDHATEYPTAAYEGGPDATPGMTRPVSWLANGISLTLDPPDLSRLGYSLVSRKSFLSEDGRVTRLTYANRQGQSFALFLRPRWKSGDIEVNLTRRGDVSVAYWLDGPVASALASDISGDEALSLAEAIRQEIGKPGSAPDREPTPLHTSPATLSENIVSDTPVLENNLQGTSKTIQ